MFSERPWLRTLLFLGFAAIILLAVGGIGYALGNANAADLPGRMARFDGPAQGGPGGQGASSGQMRDSDGMPGSRIAMQIFASQRSLDSWSGSPFVWLLRLVLPVAAIAMLVMGAVAFFRTGGWQAATIAARGEAAKPAVKKN